jgi:hypothetical protein
MESYTREDHKKVLQSAYNDTKQLQSDLKMAKLDLDKASMKKTTHVGGKTIFGSKRNAKRKGQKGNLLFICISILLIVFKSFQIVSSLIFFHLSIQYCVIEFFRLQKLFKCS